MALRADLVIEFDGVFVAGAYASDWVDSGGIGAVSVVHSGGNNADIEESNNQSDIVNAYTVTNGDTVPLTARYFRATASGGATAPYHIAVRAVAAYPTGEGSH